jgi:hypothetical protein
MTDYSKLVQVVRQKRTMLFVGAGVSANIGLPAWGELMAHIATELGFDPRVFETFGDNYLLAEYYRLQKGTLGPLRSWMDRAWDRAAVDVAKSEVHKHIVDLNFPIIYTTNYDRWLERAYDHYKEEYKKVANIADVAEIPPGKTQIIKFHGDFDYEDSIVLTESKYFERMNFETHLDYKLQSDMMQFSVLFVGYSVTDINIRYLIYKIDRLWRGSPHISARPPSFLFLTRPNPVVERVLESRGITTIVGALDDPAESLKGFLAKLKTDVAATRT